MPVIAVTGGIGSGKSTVREIFESLGAVGIDADELARRLVKPGTVGFRRVREAFGDSYIDRDGRLNRKKLAGAVFGDAAQRRKLESILHPLIREAEALLVSRALREAPGIVVVVEVPLLIEGGLAGSYDGTVLVTAGREVRLRRLVKSGAYTREEASARMRSQAAAKDRAGLAGWKVDNGSSVENTRKQVEKIFVELLGMKKTGEIDREKEQGT